MQKAKSKKIGRQITTGEGSRIWGQNGASKRRKIESNTKNILNVSGISSQTDKNVNAEWKKRLGISNMKCWSDEEKEEEFRNK